MLAISLAFEGLQELPKTDHKKTCKLLIYKALKVVHPKGLEPLTF
jgi:hypothetical protein